MFDFFGIFLLGDISSLALTIRMTGGALLFFCLPDTPYQPRSEGGSNLAIIYVST